MTFFGYFFLLFYLFSTAIVYLESRQKLHRDISYTNILLREQGQNSSQMLNSRNQFIQQLGLADIEKQRRQLQCREGLLVDFDYAAELTTEIQTTEQDDDEDDVDDEE